MAVDGPRTTAGTDRPKSFELIFAELNRRTSPKPSRLIKLLYFGLHDATATSFPTNVPHSRSHRTSQRYTLGDQRYSISSYVDSQNGFGAMVRTHWTATVSVNGETVRLEDLQTR
jgi:hypothetical protein